MVPVVAGQAVGNFIWHFIKRFSAFLFCAGLVWAVYVTVVRPHTKGTFKNKQEAERISNYDNAPKQTFFGCANYKILEAKKNDKVDNSK